MNWWKMGRVVHSRGLITGSFIGGIQNSGGRLIRWQKNHLLKQSTFVCNGWWTLELRFVITINTNSCLLLLWILRRKSAQSVRLISSWKVAHHTNVSSVTMWLGVSDRFGFKFNQTLIRAQKRAIKNIHPIWLFNSSLNPKYQFNSKFSQKYAFFC